MKAKNKMYCVYRHIAPNGKMYVGLTCQNPKVRWANGYGYKQHPFFYNAINKYGWDNFKHEILLDNLTQQEAELAERLFIGYWNLTNKTYGYNISNGGTSTGKHTEETKHKISKSLHNNAPWLGKHIPIEIRNKISFKNRGRKQTKETKDKISKANKGRKMSIEHRNKHMLCSHKKSVVQIDVQNNRIINQFVSCREASRATGINSANISRCCRNSSYTAGGYKWAYI